MAADIAGGQLRALRQQPAQQLGVPARPAAAIEAGDGAAGQELADHAHRRLVGGPQQFVDDGHLLELSWNGREQWSGTRWQLLKTRNP